MVYTLDVPTDVTPADEPDMDAVHAILAPVEHAWHAGSLTREQFDAAWAALEPILGDSPEGMEALTLFAQPGWLDEPTASPVA